VAEAKRHLAPLRCGREGTRRRGAPYEIKEVRGQISMPWTWLARRRDRAEVRRLSGQNSVPVLVLDDGAVIAGSKQIVKWAGRAPGTVSSRAAGLREHEERAQTHAKEKAFGVE
jgi:glutathione S-transferase